MFSAGVISESQSTSVQVLMAVHTSKVGAAQYGASTEPLEGQGGSFTRIGTIQEYTAARANANFSSGSDHQPLDIMVKGNLYRCTRIMNMNDVSAVGVHLCTVTTIHLQAREGDTRDYGLHDLTQKPGKTFMSQSVSR